MTKTKRLGQVTIIPSNLYVPREADRQLQDVISEMGRPAYLLVARQMGKTNLLIHAKQVLQTAADLYVYFDLSNRFSTIVELFRHVVDTATSIRSGLSDLAPKLIQLRSLNLAPHQEYEGSLRLLLGKIEGNFVIILDEIDSLASCSFSDQFFSQIRSMYFARTNYSEFNRLTYVLSGVAEPSDLIKDKTVSPFNIGQKIYLDDFSRPDVDTFLSKAGISLPSDVADRIFYWADGNPRMTWDICSELEENFLVDDLEISVVTIDNIVEKLYLSQFNKAPVDHIRNLVEADRSIRDAIKSLRANKLDELSDRLRSQLYLAGIIKSEFRGKEIRLKNRIIDEALTEEWVDEINRKVSNALSLATAHLVDYAYDKAIPYFLEFLSDENGDFEKRIVAQYRLGICYYHLKSYHKAVEFLRPIFDADDEHKDHTGLLLGISLLRLGRNEESLPFLRHTIYVTNSNEYKIPAKANLAAACLKLGGADNTNTAIQLFLETINEISETPEPERAKSLHILTSANHNIAQAYLDLGNRAAYKEHLEAAYQTATTTQSPAIIVSLIDLENQDKKTAMLDRLSEDFESIYLKSTNEAAAEDDLSQLSKSEQVVKTALLTLWTHGHDKFVSSLEIACQHMLQKPLSKAEMYLNLWIEAFVQKREGQDYVKLLDVALEEASTEGNNETALEVLTYLVAFTRVEDHILPYVTLFVKHRKEQLLLTDMSALVTTATFLLKQGSFTILESYLNIFDDKRAHYKGGIADFLSVDYFKMALYRYQDRKKELRSVSQQILRFFENNDGEKSHILSDSFLKSIREIATKWSPELQAIDRFRQYGRNARVTVQYKSGEQKISKFKYVEADLRTGLCEII